MEITESGGPSARKPAPPPSALPSLEDAAEANPRQITVDGTIRTVTCRDGLSILDAFERARNPLAANGEVVVRVGCRRGGCGICKVKITEGSVRTGPMRRAHVSEQEEAEGYVLACCAYPESDLAVASVPVAPRTFK